MAPQTIGSSAGISPADLFQPSEITKGDSTGRRQELLGNLGFIIDPKSFSRSDVPYLQARLNFDNLILSEKDRTQSFNLLNNQLRGVGQSPEQEYARRVAVWRLQNPDPIDQQGLSMLFSRARQGAATGLESARRNFSESLSARGLSGAPTAFQSAAFSQAADQQAQDEMQRVAIENAIGRRSSEGEALSTLQSMASQDEARRLALSGELSQLLQTDRGGFDLSGLAAKIR